MGADEIPEGRIRPMMLLGTVLGIILGAVLGRSGLLSTGLYGVSATLGASFVLLQTCFPLRLATSASWIVAELIIRVGIIVGAVLALSIFVGAILGISYLVGMFFALPLWAGHWDRYSITRDYLWEGILTVIGLLILQWVFREDNRPFINAILGVYALLWFYGIGAVVVASLAFIPFLVVIIPLALFSITLPTGLLGMMIGGLLGGGYGALLGLGAWAVGNLLFSWL